MHETTTGTTQNAHDPAPIAPGVAFLPTIDAATIRRGQRLGRYALLLDGDRLSPRYRNGDMLVIDARATPTTGDAVIIETATGYGCMLLNGDGDATDNRGGYVPAGAFTVRGVVTTVCPITQEN